LTEVSMQLSREQTEMARQDALDSQAPFPSPIVSLVGGPLDGLNLRVSADEAWSMYLNWQPGRPPAAYRLFYRRSPDQGIYEFDRVEPV
jgi:hypothetical protein